MIAVMLCAASKKPNASHHAGHLRRRDGRKVLFVAKPEQAPAGEACVYARPDDVSDSGRTWRDELLRYSREYRDAPNRNPLGLLPAWKLYSDGIFARIKGKYGTERLYILSAGWGLIKADFLTPNYDITFSNQANPCKKKGKRDRCCDLCMLPADTDETIVFFISKASIGFACRLTEKIEAPRHIFYNSKDVPEAPGCILEKYSTRRRTNWHCECAEAFMKGSISLSDC